MSAFQSHRHWMVWSLVLFLLATGCVQNPAASSGDNDTSDNSTATPVLNHLQLAVYDNTGIGLDEQGRVCEFTYNVTDPTSTFSDISCYPEPTGVITVERTSQYYLALDEHGDVWAWGENLGGVLGVPRATEPFRPQPARVQGLPPIQHLDLGSRVTAVDESGHVWIWGMGSTEYGGPGLIPGLEAIRKAFTYQNWLIALDEGGRVWTWEWLPVFSSPRSWTSDSYQELYLPREESSILFRIVDVLFWNGLFAALDEDGSLWLWGHGSQDQYGPMIPTRVWTSTATAMRVDRVDLLLLSSSGETVETLVIDYYTGVVSRR